MRASAIWKVYAVNQDDLRDEIKTLKAVYDVQKQLADDVYARNLKVLADLSGRPIGKAKAGYSIWGDEVNALRTIVNAGSGPRYDVQPLSIFNVTMGPTVLDDAPSSSGGDKTPEDQAKKTSQVTLLAPALIGTPTERTTSYKDASGQPVRILGSDPHGAEVGVYQAVISQGAYCSASPTLETQSVRMAKNDHPQSDDDYLTPHAVYQFKLRDNRHLFYQPVELAYDYYVKADPVEVKCVLTVDSFMNYMRNQGNDHILFWGHDWDETTRTAVQNNGLTCTEKNRPVGTSTDAIAAHAQMVDALEERLSQELLSEFILDFAKSWEVRPDPSPVNMQTKSGLEAVGNGMALLCGSNPYCLVGSIVLKSADELFGAHSGTTSDNSSVTGTLTRDYSEDSFTIQHGTTSITLTVDE